MKTRKPAKVESVSPAKSASASVQLKLCGLSALIVFVICGVFLQVSHHEFVNYDDDFYVYKNPNVSAGLSLGGISWAFKSCEASNWHPLTWLSHMLDCQMYGLKPGGHHLTSLMLHTVAAVLLFILLWRMTGALWRSLLAAMVFAIHPLRVESVAWVAERKDVLSGGFFMLTLLTYVFYVQRSKADNRRAMIWYGLILVLFACGLMSKPMLVTLPLVLLLLDFWPLQRISNWRPVLLEKIPMFVLSLLSGVITLVAQKSAIQSLERIPFPARMENALISVMIYVRQMLWPVNLAAAYPLSPENLTLLKVASALAFLLVVSIGAIILRRRHPYLLVGWFWFLIMLLPVIGLLQVGGQAHADRYTYLPHIGLGIALVWLAGDVLARQKKALIVGGATVVIALSVCAWKQTSYWQSSETLWKRSLACNPNNDIAHVNLAMVYYDSGQLEKAVEHFKVAVASVPKDPLNQTDLGKTLCELGRYDEGIPHLRMAQELQPDNPMAYVELGNALLKHGEFNEAIKNYEKALAIQPNDAAFHDNLATALFMEHRVNQAIQHYETALRLNPDIPNIHSNYGYVLLQIGQVDQAISHLRRALEIQPDHANAKATLQQALAAQSGSSNTK